MIVLKAMGGLGNQMSQVAYALAISKMYGEKIHIDTTSYIDYKIRSFSIDKLRLCESIIVDDSLTVYSKRMKFAQKIYSSLHYHLAKKRPLGKRIYQLFVFLGHYYSFDSLYYGIPKTSRKQKDIYGYFLSEGYFSQYKSELVDMFETRDEYLSKRCLEYGKMIEKSECPVAISIRLQDDYVKNETNNVCTKEYYLKAIEVLKGKINNADFFVFADDIERAKALDLGIEAVYFDNISDVEGMYLLKRCRHYIISNSSFAWWGGYLGNASDKIVLAPNRWMNDGRDYSSKYYEQMIPIKF